MSIPRLSVVGSDMHGRWDTEYLPADPANYGDAPTCPECGAFIGSRRWLDPLRASLTVHGEGPGDFAFGAGDFLVTESAVASLRDQGIVAFEKARTVAVTASRAWSLGDLPRYVYPDLPVGPAADANRSVIVSNRPNPCGWCGPNAADAIGSIYIDAATWEDTDLFVPRRIPGLVLASQRFVDAVQHARLTGIRFVEAEHHRWDPLNLLRD
jgi:Protein of unknown function (Gmx_para_CXXCG)